MFARCLPLLLGILLAGPATGEPAPPAPDFSAGFAKLVALGLPALDANAKWSTLPDAAGGGDYNLRELFKSLKGNGWTLPPADGKSLCLPAGAVATSDLAATSNNPAPPRGLLGRILGGGGGDAPPKPASAPTADLAKDVRTLIKKLHKETADSDGDADPFAARSSGSLNAHLSGRILLIATQIYQNGNTALANELAMAVLDLSPSREPVVNAAVTIIADDAYETAAKAFFASYDWADYHRALTTLIAKFPRGWAAREAVAMLVPQLAKQAAGEPPATPSLPSIPLDPGALDAIQQLTAKPAASNSAEDDEKLAKLYGVHLKSMPPQVRQQVLASMRAEGMMRCRSSGLWLLDTPDPKSTSPSPLAKITALGVAALPALAALVNDPYLTPLPNEGASESSSYYSSDEGDAERIHRLHASLNRPSTRGELACSLLRATLPDPANDNYQADPEALRELALTFWKANQNASRDELAAVFLRDGSPNQAQQAATLLAASADPKARQVFEAHVLAADPAITQFQNVRTYLTARKAAAKPFFDAYAKLVRSQSAGAADDNNSSNEYAWQIKQAGGPEKILKQLANLVTGASPRAVAKEIAKGNPKDARPAITALVQSMKDETPVKRLSVLLEGAVAAEDPAIRCDFLNVTYGTGPQDDEDEDPIHIQPKPSADRALPEAEIKVWQQLVADSRKNPNDSVEDSTVGDLAASMLEISVNPAHWRATLEAAPILRKPAAELLRDRAAARLAGKPIPPLPDASHVTPDRLGAIVTAAAAKPAAEIHPYLNTLTPDERAAWLAWLAKPGDIPIPQSVKDLSFLVVGRSDRPTYGIPDAKGASPIDTGFVVNAANLKAYVESLAKDAAKHSLTSITLEPAEFGPGLEVLAQVFPLPQKPPENKPDDDEFPQDRYQPDARSAFYQLIQLFGVQESAEAMILVRMSDNRNESGIASWFVENGTAKPLTSEMQDGFGTVNLQDLMGNLAAKSCQITIQVLSKPDADKIAESTRD